MKLSKLVDHAVNKERFQNVQDYIDFCKRFLDFTNSGIQAVILSQNEQHYKFLQYKDDGFRNVTRPINSNLMLDADNFSSACKDFLNILAALKDRAFTTENPCRLFVRSAKKGGQRFAEKPAPDQVWTDDDLQRLSVELGEHILVPLLALLTGLRQEEQFSIRKDHIEWDRGCLTLDDPKAGVSQVAYLSQDALKLLRHQAAKSGESPFLYPSPRWPMDKPMNGKSWYALYFKPAARRAGLTIGRQHGKTWHTLRHSFADRLLDLKVHIKDVQGAGRWESMAAMTRYLKKRQERVAAGVALLQSPIALDTVLGTDSKPTLKRARMKKANVRH